MGLGSEENLGQVVQEVKLQNRQMVQVDSKSGISTIVFGRAPAAEYAEKPVKIEPGVLPVRLAGTVHESTSRQQFSIDRQGNAPFILTNLSKTIILQIVDGLGEKRNLSPRMQTHLAKNTLAMQRVKISWFAVNEVSVQSVATDSGDKNWSVGFMWRNKELE